MMDGVEGGVVSGLEAGDDKMKQGGAWGAGASCQVEPGMWDFRAGGAASPTPWPQSPSYLDS